MKKILVMILFLMVSLLLGACNKEDNKEADGRMVKVYYVDSKTYGLVSEKYKLIGTKTNDQIDELLYMLQKTPENAVYKSALPSSSKKNIKYSFDNTGCLIVDFTSAYNELTNTDEILCRAAVVKTLSQLSDVEYVQFTVEGQPLQDTDGIVGPLTSDDFVINTEASTNYKAKLYFANKTGDKLIEYNEKINYTGSEPLEELVIRRLMDGPLKENMYPTFPKGTKLLNISKVDGICTVDFNDKFLDKLPDITEKVAIYSVVNTLVELPDINKVQFTINSEIQKTYWEDIKLDDIFEANLDMIENPS